MTKSGMPEVIPSWAIPQMTPAKGCEPPTPLFSLLPWLIQSVLYQVPQVNPLFREKAPHHWRQNLSHCALAVRPAISQEHLSQWNIPRPTYESIQAKTQSGTFYVVPLFFTNPTACSIPAGREASSHASTHMARKLSALLQNEGRFPAHGYQPQGILEGSNRGEPDIYSGPPPREH